MRLDPEDKFFLAYVRMGGELHWKVFWNRKGIVSIAGGLSPDEAMRDLEHFLTRRKP